MGGSVSNSGISNSGASDVNGQAQTPSARRFEHKRHTASVGLGHVELRHAGVLGLRKFPSGTPFLSASKSPTVQTVVSA